MTGPFVSRRLYTCVVDLEHVYWAYQRRAKIRQSFSDVFIKTQIVLSIESQLAEENPPTSLKVYGLSFRIIRELSSIDVKSLGRISPKMTAEQKTRTLELVAELEREIKLHLEKSVDVVFGLLRPKLGFAHVPDDKLRLAISNGIEEVEKLVAH